MRLNKKPDVFGDDKELIISEVCLGRGGKEDETAVYFSGLMMVNNYQAANRILGEEEAERLSTADFMRRALKEGLKI